MNYSKYDSKNDPKSNNAGHASVTLPSTPDANKSKGPLQGGDQKSNEAKPAVQAPGAPDVAKSHGQNAKADTRTDHATTEDKASGESMVSEGGHASPGRTPNAVREPDASVAMQNEPSKGSADGAADKPGLSVKSAS